MARKQRMLEIRHVSAAMAVAATLLWIWAEAAARYPSVNLVGDIDDVALLARISFFTMMWTGVAAWRADVPTKE